MHEVNWHKFDSAEATVDPPDEFIHRSPQVLVLLDILPRWNGELYKDDLWWEGTYQHVS